MPALLWRVQELRAKTQALTDAEQIRKQLTAQLDNTGKQCDMDTDEIRKLGDALATKTQDVQKLAQELATKNVGGNNFMTVGD